MWLTGEVQCSMGVLALTFDSRSQHGRRLAHAQLVPAWRATLSWEAAAQSCHGMTGHAEGPGRLKPWFRPQFPLHLDHRMRSNTTESCAVDAVLLLLAHYAVDVEGMGRNFHAEASSSAATPGLNVPTQSRKPASSRDQVQTRSACAGRGSDERLAAAAGDGARPGQGPDESVSVLAHKRHCFRWPDEVKIALCKHLADLGQHLGPSLSRCGIELSRRVSRDLGYTVAYRSLRDLRYNLPGRIRTGKESPRVVDAFSRMEDVHRRMRAGQEHDTV